MHGKLAILRSGNTGGGADFSLTSLYTFYFIGLESRPSLTVPDLQPEQNPLFPFTVYWGVSHCE